MRDIFRLGQQLRGGLALVMGFCIVGVSVSGLAEDDSKAESYVVAAIDKEKLAKLKISIRKATPKKKAGKFSVTYYNETYLKTGELNHGEWDNSTAFNHFMLSYQTSNGYKWSIVPQITSSWKRIESGTVEQTTAADDVYLALNKNKLYEFSSDLYINLLVKAFYPVKKASRELNSKELRTYFWFVKKLAKGWSIEYLANPRYYWHSFQRVQEFDDKLSRDTIKGVKSFVYFQEVRAKYNFEKAKLVPYHAFGGWHQYNFRGADSVANGDILTLETGLEWSPFSNLWLSLSLFQERDIRKKDNRSFAVYDDKETSYYLQFATWY